MSGKLLFRSRSRAVVKRCAQSSRKQSFTYAPFSLDDSLMIVGHETVQMPDWLIMMWVAMRPRSFLTFVDVRYFVIKGVMGMLDFDAAVRRSDPAPGQETAQARRS